jgi:hypothetical protein
MRNIVACFIVPANARFFRNGVSKSQFAAFALPNRKSLMADAVINAFKYMNRVVFITSRAVDIHG